MIETGRVYKSTGSWYWVKDAKGDFLTCRMKGKVRLSGSKSTNPVAVGDLVSFELEPGTENGIITAIQERKNHLVRKSVNLSKQTHVIAANLDQSILVITLVDPPTSFGFVDRFLATSEAYNVPTILVYNKMDLYQSDKDWMRLAEFMDTYASAGYQQLQVSAQDGVGMEELRALLTDKVTLFSGHSGVGKSTLINTIQPGMGLRTKEISGYHKKGQHTTTFAEMFDLVSGGQIIDTPGIKGFGLVDMDKEEIASYFPEIFKISSQCKFNNCLHLNEPGCAVKAAFESGDISPNRFISYTNILQGLEDDDTYRKPIYG
ncbi:MAG: ribosome small subunit-dependent GTPase A [Schleiferiaceae bacterium]|nr:ribosome small subunit-dependent GTPase A [Schleiferiaceae bacterium]